MFIPYLRAFCLTFIFICFSSASFADVYKWVDNKGDTHYSEQAPNGQETQVIKPPPPAVDPAQAQKEVDILIEKQQGIYEDQQEQRKIAADNKAKQQELKKYCQVARQNLATYQNNPGRRIINPDGTVIGPNENLRQQKITSLQADITKYCQ